MKHRLINWDNQCNVQFSNLGKIRREGDLCDVILVANDVEVRAHKIVLAACSHYFHAMFTNFAESKKDRIIMENIDGNTLQILIEYVYRAEVFLAEKDAQPLLLAASYLQLTELKDACCEFLKERLNPTNCLCIASFAHKYDYVDLEATANAYTEDNFGDVVKSEDFLQLTINKLIKLVEKDRIIASEEQVFESVISWMTNNITEREKFILDIMEHVRMPLLSNDFLYNRVKEEPLLKRNPQCLHFLLEALKYSSIGKEQKALMKSPRFKARYWYKVLLAIGGDSTQKNVECFGFKDGSSFRMTDMPDKNAGFGATAIRSTAYAIGGKEVHLSNSMISFDSKKNIWSSCANMNYKRRYPGIAVLGDLIYAIGGLDGRSYLSSAEVYNPDTDKWKMIASMGTARYGAGVAAISGKLYAVGGCNGSTLSSMESYCVQCNKWTTLTGMDTARNCAGVAAMDGLLYAVGGDMLRSGEVYDPKIGKWSHIADMNICRYGAGLIPSNSLLYVVGGQDENGTRLSSIEVYDPKRRMWTILSFEMSLPRSLGGVTLIDRSNIVMENSPLEK